MADQNEKIKQIMSLMELVINDNTIPKNIRKAVSDAKERLAGDEEVITRTSAAVYALEEVGEDINMPMHARTQIWTIVSALETIKDQ